MWKMVLALALAAAAILISGCIAPANGGPPVLNDGNALEFETVAESLDVPWAIDFLPGNKIIFTERPGRVKILEDGIVHEVQGVSHISDSGLLGLAVDPDFENSSRIYVYYTYGEGDALFNRVRSE